MNSLDLQKVVEYVNDNINDFHATKAKKLAEINLKSILLAKNPYLYRAKNITVAADLIRSILDAKLFASEEEIFGQFLENLAIFISQQVCSGRKSSAAGVDLEFVSEGVHYLVSIKSGSKWGNSQSQKQQATQLQTAMQVLKQSNHTLNVQPVLGICCGKTKRSYLRGYMKVVGQDFWYLISGNENLYTDIVEPLGHRAKEHNEIFAENKAALINKFISEFMKDFCDSEVNIDWKKLVVFNSGNLKK